uniref:Peptidase M20 dimerisation domain-containing protein n=1 Tax=Chenopodium quinoa TaxID=63459 RepID=A0A803L0B4_CHEQI
MGELYSLSISIFLISLLVFPVLSTQQQEEEDNPVINRFQTYLLFKTAHPNPNYTAPVSFLISQAHSIGLHTRTFEFVPGKPVLIITWPGSRPDLPSILFNSHLDSVPAETDKWIHPPFSGVRTADGKIYARGAQDDKCIGMQYLEAIRNLRELRGYKEPTRTVHLSYVPEEEIGGLDGAAKFVASKEFEELNVGFVMDEGQASPNDDFRVFYADRSPWHVTIKANGVPGHGCRMFDNSAMENLMISIELITQFRDSQFNLVRRGLATNSQVISVNPVFFDAGILTSNGFAMNMQPSEASAGFDIRLPPTVDPEFIRDRIAHEWAPASRNMTFQDGFSVSASCGSSLSVIKTKLLSCCTEARILLLKGKELTAIMLMCSFQHVSLLGKQELVTLELKLLENFLQSLSLRFLIRTSALTL